MTSATPPVLSDKRRLLAITASVVLLHVAALWALQSGLPRRTTETVQPAVVMAGILSPAPAADPQPQPQPQPRPRAPEPAKPAPQAAKAAPAGAPAPAPAPVLVPAATASPGPAAPVSATPAPVSPAPPAIPGATTVAATGGTAAPSAGPAGAAPAAAARVELPSSEADYLNNPKPVYPPMSRRMREQGKVVVHVLIGADGSAQKAEIRQSSGYERLDQAALATVLKWRYQPGKRGGVAEAMWFNVPINFVLE